MSNNVNEEKNQKESPKIFDNFIKYLFVVVFLYCISAILVSFVDIATLDSRMYAAILLLFIISASSFALAILIYGIQLLLLILKHKSLTRNNLNAIVAEQINPTKSKYKIRIILLWSFFICGVLTLFTNIIYTIILIIIT